LAVLTLLAATACADATPTPTATPAPTGNSQGNVDTPTPDLHPGLVSRNFLDTDARVTFFICRNDIGELYRTPNLATVTDDVYTVEVVDTELLPDGFRMPVLPGDCAEEPLRFEQTFPEGP
jgi:hypothetical protein